MSTVLDKSTYKRLGRAFHTDPVTAIEDYLGVTLAETQKKIARSINDNQRTLIVSGNGTGKSYGVTIYALAFFLFNYDSLTMITSGNYDLLTDASWRPMKSIHKELKRRDPNCIGRRLESPPRVESGVSDEWFLRYISPRYPENLEGRHARRSLVVIEEADKPDISSEHFDSALSTASRSSDRMVAVANPPENKGNVVYDLMNDDRWHTINFSSFDSHNVQVELGEIDGEKIPGVVDLELIKEDWVAWNNQPWPGVETARKVEPNLDPRWYRRRLGVMPPGGAGILRPWYERHVDRAVQRHDPDTDYGQRETLGVDIARGGGDRTAIVERRGPLLRCVLEKPYPGDHTINEDLILDEYDTERPTGTTLIDAIGEGSGTADNVRQARWNVKRFKGSESAQEETEYYNRRTECIYRLGKFLKSGAVLVPNSTLEEELRTAARVFEMEERHSGSDTVFKVNGKTEIKDSRYLGHSPDVLDAAAMSVYGERNTDYTPMNYEARTA